MKLPPLWFLIIPATLVGAFLAWVGYPSAGLVVFLAVFGFWILPEVIWSKK